MFHLEQKFAALTSENGTKRLVQKKTVLETLFTCNELKKKRPQKSALGKALYYQIE